jgi:hypothetical protein
LATALLLTDRLSLLTDWGWSTNSTFYSYRKLSRSHPVHADGHSLACMADFLAVLGTVLFVVLMLLFIKGLEHV